MSAGSPPSSFPRRQHPDFIAGAAHQHGFDLIVAEDMAARAVPLPGRMGIRQCAMKGFKPEDGVVAPIGSAVALPPRAAGV